jgi:hypothetical protein
MSDITLKPFQACSKFYKLSQDNVVEVNDCCFQSCYRYAGQGPQLQQCLDNCAQGQDTLTEVMGKTPCSYGRRFKAPPTHDEPSVFYNFLQQGMQPEDATNSCVNMAKTQEQRDHCLIDSLSYIMGNSEQMTMKSASPSEEEKKKSYTVAHRTIIVVIIAIVVFAIIRGLL